MDTLTIARVLDGSRRGSSRPVLVETAVGQQIVKLRGAAQGTGPLVAEVIVAAFAEALGLRVPARTLVTLEHNTPTNDPDQELRDLLAASVGLNLGFSMLAGARPAAASDLAHLAPAEAAAVLWLDRFVSNPDRTDRNPNLLWWAEKLWLIDHGAALRFQYNWTRVTEATPREAESIAEPHLFETMACSNEWPAWDATFADCITRPGLEAAVAAVPSSFLVPLLRHEERETAIDQAQALRRRRAAYVAFLWKRLQPPRAFADTPPTLLQTRSRGIPPGWLKRVQ